MPHTSAAMTSLSAVTATVVIGPMAEVFDQTGLLLFIMGALGGLTGHFAIRLPLRLAIYPAVVGGLLGFGLAVVAPPLLNSMLPLEVPVEAGSSRGLAAMAYLLGLLHERVLIWLREDREHEG